MLASLAQHEVAQGFHRLLQGCLRRDALRQVRLDHLGIEAFPYWTHNENSKKKRQPDQHLVRWDLLHAKRLTQQRQHNDDPCKGRHGNEQSRNEGEEGHQQEDLQGYSKFSGLWRGAKTNLQGRKRS